MAFADEDAIRTLAATSGAPDKIGLYGQEALFREACGDAVEILGDAAETVLSRIAVLTLKPDAVVGRRGARSLAFARARGFRVIAHRRFAMNRLLMHEIWRYQWNRATVDKLRLSEILFARTSCLSFYLLDEAAASGAAVGAARLSASKGSADAALRAPDSLRSELGMTNRLLSFVHTPDEPADVIRELGLIFSPNARRALLRALLSSSERDETASALDVLARLEAGTVEHSLQAAEVLQRRFGRRDLGGLALAAGVRRGPFRLAEIAAAMGGTRSQAALWDFITVAADLIDHNIPGVSPRLEPRHGQQPPSPGSGM